jgi:opacity protein-like surface antigen
MHRSCCAPSRFLAIFTVVASFALCAATASAQDEGEDALELFGLFSARYAHAYEMSDLDVGGELDDSRGVDLAAGFRAGEYFAFQVGYEWQTDQDFDSHYFPLIFRGYSPALFERARLYGEAGLGLFFTRPHDDFNGNGNERASAFHVGGGLQIDITEAFGLLWYLKYKRGLGEVDDWESVVNGVGLQYTWGL